MVDVRRIRPGLLVRRVAEHTIIVGTCLLGTVGQTYRALVPPLVRQNHWRHLVKQRACCAIPSRSRDIRVAEERPDVVKESGLRIGGMASHTTPHLTRAKQLFTCEMPICEGS